MELGEGQGGLVQSHCDHATIRLIEQLGDHRNTHVQFRVLFFELHLVNAITLQARTHMHDTRRQRSGEVRPVLRAYRLRVVDVALELARCDGHEGDAEVMSKQFHLHRAQSHFTTSPANKQA